MVWKIQKFTIAAEEKAVQTEIIDEWCGAFKATSIAAEVKAVQTEILE